MTLRLVLENAPQPQAVTERQFEGGQLVIGRSDDADWQLVDPDMYVSRRHAILTERDGQVMVTDASSGGLFIDNAANPVGTGNAVPLEPGMRLRLGDFVLRVEAVTTGAAPAPEAPERGGFSFEFGPPEPPKERAPRPDSLPDPFGLGRDAGPRERSRERKEPAPPPRPLDQEDPFSLDLRRAFSDPPKDNAPPPQAAPPAPRKGGYFDAFTDPEGASTPSVRETEEDVPERYADNAFARPEKAAEDARPRQAAPAPPVQPHVAGADEAALRAALFRGMGLDPAQLGAGPDPEAEMEAIGARLRDLVDGVMLLLRTRAQEKQKVRVAQTIIASADVNPLKFLATTDEALAALIRPRGKGYLPPEQAVHGAFRDLTDHQVRTWSALQTALRRMIDKFDPAEIEKEMEDTGLLEKLIAGGKSAKLWQLYEERYREIARSAEEQFLGDVGADFRDAYEGDSKRRK